MTEDNQEESVKVDHLVEALNHYGASDVLDLLVRFSTHDWAVRQLLIRFPSVVSISHFMFKKPSFEIKGLSSEEFFNTNCPIRVGEEKGQNQKSEIREKASTPKKRNRKRTQKSPGEGRKEPLERAGDKADCSPDTGEDVMKEMTDDMKLKLAWSCIECREYESGLILYQSLPEKTYGEHKANGVARALLEMKKLDYAKKTLVEGLKQYPKSSCLWNTLGKCAFGVE